MKTKIIGSVVVFILLLVNASFAGYTDNGDGTIKDTTTGRVWQKCSAGQNSTDCGGTAGTYTWANAVTYCTGLILVGGGWRLPNVKELESIVDETKASSPTINTTVFPATVGDLYWSSTTYANYTTNAWYVNFYYGSVDNYSKTNTFYVRCVR